MSGWDFFRSEKKYVLLQRSYNITGGLNDSICLKAPFRPIVYQNNTLEKTFTYRNMSSTYKLDLPGGAAIWPSARFLMEFSAKDSTPAKVARVDPLNYVNSTFIYAAHGYNIPAPTWKFRYCDETCAVIEVLSKHKNMTGDSTCELWVRVGLKETLYLSAQTEACKSYFQTSCYTSYPTQVYIPSLCN
uniref:Lipocalin n=1 Tax=Rhipicephalus zambeziensis TaxID=60191 RepID=A0A224YEH8_9ACAR